jgi:hypothetical protein
MSLFDDQPAREIGWSALKQMGLIREGNYAAYPLIRQRLNCHGLQEITQYSRTTNKLKQQPFS